MRTAATPQGRIARWFPSPGSALGPFLFRIQGLGLRAECLGFRVRSCGCGCRSLALRGLGFKGLGFILGYAVWGLGLREVQGKWNLRFNCSQVA